MSEIEAVAHASVLPPRQRRWLAVMVGIAAVLAAVFGWAERDAGRHEEQALQDASRGTLRIFVNIAGSQAKNQFTADNLRRSLLVGQEGLARVIAGKGEAFKIATTRQPADSRAQKRLLEVAKAMDGSQGKDTPVDSRTAEALNADEGSLNRDLKAQNQAVVDANNYSSQGQRATYALGLTAVAAALLALAGLMGAARSGRVALVAAGVALVFSAVWGATGFL